MSVYNITINIGEGHKEARKHAYLDFRVGYPELKKGAEKMELTITNEQKILLTPTPVTAAGHPARIDGAIRVEKISGDGDFLLQPDNLSFYLISGDTVTDTLYHVSADADLGEGTRLLEADVTLHVIEAEANALGLTVGQPELK